MSPPIWHLVPMDLPRGAQVYAGAARNRLAADGVRHQLITLFRAPQAVLTPDFALDVPMTPLRRFGFDPRVLHGLRRLARRERPGFVVAHGSEPLKYALAARIDAPIAAYRIGVSLLEDGFRQALFGRQLRRARYVAGVSQEVLDESVTRFGVSRSKCVLIPNGRDPSVYRPSPEGPAEVPEVLFIGHFDTNKRPELFIRTIAHLRESCPVPFVARMIGEGSRFESMRAEATDAGVELLGRRTDVPDLLRRGAVLLATSIAEGLPGVFIEAGLSGMPVVTTAVPGAHDVIDDPQTGRIVADATPEALAAAVQPFLIDRALQQRVGAAARERCIRDFSIEAGLDRWRELFARHGLQPQPSAPVTA